jgi:hypothetical protein
MQIEDFRAHAHVIKLLNSRIKKSQPSVSDNIKIFKKRRSKFQPGDLVQILTEDEIIATLDKNGKYKGLIFTEEMKKFCGKKYRVYKNVEKVMLESTGELRRVKVLTVLLDDVVCDGSNHGGCDRSCYLYWREKWLKPLDI